MAVERDQEKVSTSELLLEGYLHRLGGIQTHLQERPKASLASTPTATGGARLTEVWSKTWRSSVRMTLFCM